MSITTSSSPRTCRAAPFKGFDLLAQPFFQEDGCEDFWPLDPDLRLLHRRLLKPQAGTGDLRPGGLSLPCRRAPPDHDTLATFRRRFPGAFSELLVQVPELAREMKLLRHWQCLPGRHQGACQRLAPQRALARAYREAGNIAQGRSAGTAHLGGKHRSSRCP